jgi:hypothetical protein
MNTTRSEAVLARHGNRVPEAVTRVVRHSQTISGSREDVFPLLCPAREADWLPGWEAELVQTESGFAEEWCVFQTPEENHTGPGLWVFTRHQPPELVEIIRFCPPVLVRIRISLEEVETGQTVIHWEYTLTGLTGEGNEIVEEAAAALPERAKASTMALEHYLQTGEMAAG